MAIVLVAAAAALALGAKDGGDGGGKTYYLYFDNAFGLTKGGDFKVAGVRAGQTTDFKVQDAVVISPSPCNCKKHAAQV